MADVLPFFASETGTYSTTGPSVTLSGTAANLGVYPSRTFAAADADTTTTFASGNTCTVVIVKDASNYKRYSGATWTDASPDTISLASATLEGSAGTLSDSDAVTVYASLPSAPLAHDHSSNKLAQANTHESADTDSATSSLHHTIGTGATNAAAGNHIHDPDKLSGAYYSGGISALSFGTTAATANTFRAYPFVVRKSWTITEIVCEVTAAGAAGTKYRVAIYSDDGSLRPGNIVSGTDVSEADANTVGFTTFTLASPITLSPGVYWAAHLTDGTPTMRTISGGAVESILGVTASSTATLTYSSVSKGSVTYGAMPSSISGTTLSGGAVAAFRMKTQ